MPVSQSGKRLVGKRTAPELPVVYRCEGCQVEVVRDAYQGVPSCMNHPAPRFLEPVRLANGGI